MINRLQRWVRNIFGFSRAETNGLLVMLPLMLTIIFSQPLYRKLKGDPPLKFDSNQEKIDSLIASWDFNPSNDKESFILFYFDPNKIGKRAFDSLGFPPFLTDRIINYRNKGGRFKVPQDLLKIYGMDTAWYETIYPYIIIPQSPTIAAREPKKQFSEREKEYTAIKFDINTADTIQLKLIRGIGTVLAARIIKYREALGGFNHLNQINEVYGLDSVVVKELKSKVFISPGYIPRQLNINKATEREFARHPYIDYKLSKTIIAYRFQHGSFAEINDLLKIELLNKEKLDQIRPYLKVEP